MEKITSLQNPRIKNLLILQQKSRERRQQNLAVVEGFRETSIAVNAGFSVIEAFYCPEVANLDLSLLSTSVKVIEINRPVFEKLAYREGSDGFIALIEPRNLTLNDLVLKDNPLVVILESVEKPGNLGAILRTADAVNADAVIVCDPLTDIWNPNVIRSSIGCVFSRQVVTSTTEQAQQWLKAKRISSYAAELSATSPYHKFDYTGSTAFIMGTEANGLTDKWISFCDHRIIIPMLGSIDSLNVSVSTAILLFEAMRQREFQ